MSGDSTAKKLELLPSKMGSENEPICVTVLKQIANFHKAVIYFIADSNGKVLSAGDMFHSVLGYKSGELSGVNRRQLLSDINSNEVLDSLVMTVARGEVWSGDLCYRSKTGNYYWLETTALPQKNTSGVVEAVLFLHNDVTSRKILEEKLIEVTENEREANSAKSEFLANMSHEIRTPMNGILGMCQLLQTTHLLPEQSEYSEAIQKSAEGLLVIINDILDFSKIEAKKMELELEEFDLLKVCRDVVKTFEFSIQKKKLFFKQEYEGLEYSVLGDAGRIGQILFNLIGNAIKFTHAGGVTLRVKVLDDSSDSYLLSIEIQDTGVGIPADAQHRMFEAFSQANTTVTKKYGGTGLGLSISKHLIELMNGNIVFLSEENIGTTFFVQLRMKKGGKTEARIDKSKTVSVDIKFNAKVLIAEDNQTNQMVLTKMLKKLGCNTTVVSDGNEIMDTLMSAKYDLILMDCQMPIMDGFEATKVIRESKHGFQSIPIVAMTANAMRGDKEKCLSHGMTDYVSKPVYFEDLVSTFEKYLKVNASGDVLKTEAPCLNYESIKKLRALQIDGEPDIIKELIDSLFKIAPKRIANIGKAVVAKNASLVSSEAHAFKSSALILGAEPVAKLCAQLESEEVLSDWSTVSEVYNYLMVEYNRLVTELQQLYNNIDVTLSQK